MVDVTSIDNLAELCQGQVYQVADYRGQRRDEGPALLWEVIEQPDSASIYRFIRPAKTLPPGHLDDISALESQIQIVDNEVHLVSGKSSSSHYGSMQLGYFAMKNALKRKGFNF